MADRHFHIVINKTTEGRLVCRRERNAEIMVNEASHCSNVEYVEYVACTADCTEVEVVDRLAADGCPECGSLDLYFTGFGEPASTRIVECNGCGEVLHEFG